MLQVVLGGEGLQLELPVDVVVAHVPAGVVVGVPQVQLQKPNNCSFIFLSDKSEYLHISRKNLTFLGTLNQYAKNYVLLTEYPS